MTCPSLYTCLLLLGELVGNGIRPPRSVGGTPGVVAGGLVGTTSADAANLSSLSASESLQGRILITKIYSGTRECDSDKQF